ncbi:MAG: type II toxin-antitoxin system PemK/MazF family toxin [Spirochaetaceae bacterium]|jgi:mRNA interferase MazF|nr:type II toxin-antitoxin system PemK/MazF family toxin [Spirochaetaceae bacterium]
MTRGELWWADFGVPFGSEPGYKRPVLIMQNDYFNNSRINTTIVIPLTTNMVLADAPGNIVLTPNDSKLKKESVVVVSQIEVIDRQRLIEKITKVDRLIIKQIEEQILFVLGIHNI